ncbi:MAG: hypothetical protein GEU86_08995 [Actinophytocola sp.]|nr:hypothetical protein [Actinophytocola sp.]
MTTLADAFASFRTSAWRLEARDDYDVPEYADELSAFRAGLPRPPRSDGWKDIVQGAVWRGAHIGRVRLVGRPISDYTRFEFALYEENVAWGEDVRLADRTWLDGSWADAPDVWLFDDEIAFRQDYTDEGRYLGASRIDAGPVREMRRLTLAAAVPLADFRLTDAPLPRPESAPAAALPYITSV